MKLTLNVCLIIIKVNTMQGLLTGIWSKRIFPFLLPSHEHYTHGTVPCGDIEQMLFIGQQIHKQKDQFRKRFVIIKKTVSIVGIYISLVAGESTKYPPASILNESRVSEWAWTQFTLEASWMPRRLHRFDHASNDELSWRLIIWDNTYLLCRFCY